MPLEHVAYCQPYIGLIRFLLLAEEKLRWDGCSFGTNELSLRTLLGLIPLSGFYFELSMEGVYFVGSV